MAKDPTQGPVTRVAPDGRQYQTNIDPEPQQANAPVRDAEFWGDPSGIVNRYPVVIMAGGKGTRLEEEHRGIIPKPLVKVGDWTLLDHIINMYASQGSKEFYIATGFQADVIHQWWMAGKEHFEKRELKVLPVPTGLETGTGGRLRKLVEKNFLVGRPFMMTYGDGLSDVNFSALIEHHLEKKNIVTLTACRPPARFGNLVIEDGVAVEFGEKTQTHEGWINAGFYIIEPNALKLINNDLSRWEYDVLPILAVQKNLSAYQHPGYFQMVDTPRDLHGLRTEWDKGRAPWLPWMR